MPDGNEAALHQAIADISQSDPIIKLLQQVALGRMKPTDAGLRAVTESWLNTYQRVLETSSLTRSALVRLDPNPRLAVLAQSGILDAASEAAQALRRTFENQLARAGSD